MGPALRQFAAHQAPQIVRALRGGGAALAALAAATLLKLENPYWAAMTAIIVIQPTRDLLFEKSFYRLVGTAIGSGAGLLLLLSTRSPLLLTIALSLWLAACVGIGNLLDGLRSYAAMMAACTCTIITMSGYQNPSHLVDIAFGRVACIIVGIVISTTVTALFTPRQCGDDLRNRLRRVVGDAVEWLALLLRQGRGEKGVRQEREILMEIAEVEALLGAAGAGSRRFRRQRRHIKSLIASLLSLLAVGRLAGELLARHDGHDRRHGYWREILAGHLDEIAVVLGHPGTANCTAEMAAAAAETREHLPLLGGTLTEIVAAIHLVLADYEPAADSPEKEPANRFVRHRDWQEARRAAVRAALAIAAVGGTWALSGWTKGPLMLMAMSIMLSIFSTKEHPASFVGQIFCGAAVGSAAAVFCRIELLPGVTDPFVTGAVIAPFIVLGVFAMQQRRTAIAATDATLFFIFVTQPGVPVAVVPADLALGAVAMLMGVGSAWLSYRYLVPIDPAIRLRSLLVAIARDIELLTMASPATVERLRARMHHRVLRMVSLATRYDVGHLPLVEGGLAALAIGTCIERLRAAREDGAPAAARLVRETLAPGSDSTAWPRNVATALESAAMTLFGVGGPGSHPSDGEAAGTACDPAVSVDGRPLGWKSRRTPCRI
ncbi:FUSC family protein [Geobacter pickeringii]|uniref:FUSC family protein n=1 Tax=Geobacter pickeringii TaxID=345632 RepID=UPI00068CB29C|nr:FUSC family protein [Geobacter pickeringii]